MRAPFGASQLSVVAARPSSWPLASNQLCSVAVIIAPPRDYHGPQSAPGRLMLSIQPGVPRSPSQSTLIIVPRTIYQGVRLFRSLEYPLSPTPPLMFLGLALILKDPHRVPVNTHGTVRSLSIRPCVAPGSGLKYYKA